MYVRSYSMYVVGLVLLRDMDRDAVRFSFANGETSVAKPGVVSFEQFVVGVVCLGKLHEIFDCLIDFDVTQWLGFVQVLWHHAKPVTGGILNDLLNRKNAKHVA